MSFFRVLIWRGCSIVWWCLSDWSLIAVCWTCGSVKLSYCRCSKTLASTSVATLYLHYYCSDVLNLLHPICSAHNATKVLCWNKKVCLLGTLSHFPFIFRLSKHLSPKARGTCNKFPFQILHWLKRQQCLRYRYASFFTSWKKQNYL